MFSFQRFFIVLSLLISFIEAANAQHGHFSYHVTPQKPPSGAAILNSLKPHPQPPPSPKSVGTPMDCDVTSQYGLIFPGVYTNIFPLPPTCAPLLSGLNGISGTVVSGIGTVSMNAFWTFYWSNDAASTVNGELEYVQGCVDDFSLVQFYTFAGTYLGEPAYIIYSNVYDRFGGIILQGSVTYTADKAPVFWENPPYGLIEPCGGSGGDQ